MISGWVTLGRRSGVRRHADSQLILDELLHDFPFVDEAERAMTVGLVILPFVRRLISGPTPLHLIEKPAPGTGASLLASIITEIATARPAAVMTEARNEDEWRKRITAKLVEGPAVVFIDNLRNRVDSASLSAVITTSVWEDRPMGLSEIWRMPVECVWIATVVFFALWQGPRPSEAIALRRQDLDLDLGTAMIRRSRVYTSEAKTKTRKSKRTIRLHPGTIRVLRSAWPIHTTPEDYVFITPGGSPINEQNFLQRIWSPALRRLGLRDRGFYACRATYSLGKKVAFVAEQTGHSIRTLEGRYKKYFPSADDLEIADQDLLEEGAPGISSTFSLHPKAKVERNGGA